MIGMPLRRWWAEPSRSITGAAAVIAAASFLSRVLGVFRDRILASEFGAGEALDVYYAAFRVPDLVYNLLVVGALSAGFIPIFVAARRRPINGEAAGWHLANAFLTVTLIGLLIVCGLGIIFIERLVPLIAPGFAPEKMAAVAGLSRIMFLSPVFLGISAIVGGVLQSHRNFFVFSLAPIFYNVGIIIGVLLLVPNFGLVGLAWGVVLGAALHLAIQFPSVIKLGWSWRWVWDFWHPDLQAIGRLMIPRTLSLGIAQLNLLILTIMASFLDSGSVAIFNLATNLYMLPVATIGIAYALAVFPALAERAVAGDRFGFRDSFAVAVRHILFFIVPATVLLLLLRAQIVRAVLGSGAFDWTDTILTFETLRWLTYSLFAQALIPVLARAFYAEQNTLIPFMAGVAGDLVTVVISLELKGMYGVMGLALAFSVGSIIQALGLWLSLHRRVGDLGERQILGALWSFTVAGLVMAFVIQGVKNGLGVLLGTTTFLDVILQGGIAALAGLITYLVVLSLQSRKEINELLSIWRWRPLVVEVSREGLDEGEGI